MRLRGGGDGVCAEWEVAVDVRKEQTFFSFSTRLLSFTGLPCGHDENNSLPEVL